MDKVNNNLHVINLNDAQVFTAYDLFCQSLFPNEIVEKVPLGAMKVTVLPGVKSARHNHHEVEVFYIENGSGWVNLNNEKIYVKKNDVIKIPAFSDHIIFNESRTEELVFLTFWWEDPASISSVLEQIEIPKGKNILVTATPPTPNGDLHLGHISGPYLGADIYARYQRFLGNNAFYLTGTDVHQTYVHTKALQKNINPETLLKENGKKIEHALASSAIKPSYFYDPRKQVNYESDIQQFFLEMFEKKLLIIRQKQEFYDGDKYLHEAYIKGNCPHCNFPSDGNCCENCGLPHDTIDIVNPESYTGIKKLQIKEAKKLFFPLEPQRTKLLNYYKTLDLPSHLRLLISQLFSKSLPEIAISHPSSWGIPHDIPGYEDQVIYVWAEMLPGYLCATEAGGNIQWKDYDQKIQFYGYDNSFYHLVLFPAMLIALDRDDCLPDSFVINEFLHLDGKKFSTSREHLIWAQDFFQNYPVDRVRMYLAKLRPESQTVNFEKQGFDQYCSDIIEAKFVTFFRSFWKLVTYSFDECIPEPGAWNEGCKQNYKLLTEQYALVIKAHQANAFSTAKIMNVVEMMVAMGLDLLSQSNYLLDSNNDRDLLRTYVALQALIIQLIAQSLVAIAPSLSVRLWQELGFAESIKFDVNPTFIPRNQMIRPDDAAYMEI